MQQQLRDKQTELSALEQDEQRLQQLVSSLQQALAEVPPELAAPETDPLALWLAELRQGGFENAAAGFRSACTRPPTSRPSRSA